MYQNTNDNKLVEMDNSIKQEKIRTHSPGRTHITETQWIERKMVDLDQITFLPDNLLIDGIPEYEKESWDDTEKLLKDELRGCKQDLD